MPRSLKWLVAFAVLLAVLGGGIFLGGHPTDLPGPLRDWLVDDDVATHAQVLDTVEDNYVLPVKGSRLENDSIGGIVRGLGDRFSAYLNPVHARIFAQRNKGRYSGVGVTVGEGRRGLKVVAVIDGSPAKAAGIVPGDIIERVDGRSIAGEPSGVSTALVRGPAGTKVSLTVLRPRTGEAKTYRMKRANVERPLVGGRLMSFGGKRYGYVGLAEFDGGAAGQLSDEVARLRRRGAKGIVLNLRGNPGGLISEAVDVASLFIDKGVIVSTKGRTRPREILGAAGDAPFPTLPLVVLVDRGTASAAEIVAGALQDHRRAKVVGGRTFGKGVFQEIFPLVNGGTLDLTVGHYYTPKGRDLGGRGLKPDVAATDDRRTRADEGLRGALRVLAQR